MQIWNCSRDFLSMCGERSTVYTVFFEGSGMGPLISAPVRLAVRTISFAERSSIALSYAFSLMRILCSATADSLLVDLGDDAGANRAAAFADREAQPLVHRDGGDELDVH